MVGWIKIGLRYGMMDISMLGWIKIRLRYVRMD